MAAESDRRGFLASWRVNPACIRNMMGEPAYVLIAHSSDPTRDRGDSYTVEIYISGVGDVELAKLYISIPAYIPETLQVDQDGTRLSVETRQLEFTSPDFLKAKEITQRHTNVFSLTVPLYIFNRTILDVDPDHLGIEGERIRWDKRFWLGIHYAPFSFSFKVAENAPPGDHNIYLHLVYKDSLRWYSNSTTLKIHIRQWYEGDLTRALVIFAAIAAIISGCWDFYNLFLK